MLRTTAISLILLLSVGVMLPFANSAHGVKQSAQVGQRNSYRKHSRAWWRRHRARLRRKRAAAMAHRNALLALPKNITVNDLAGASGPVPVLSADDVPVSAATEVAAPNATAPTASTPAITTVSAHAAPKPIAKPVSAKLPGQMNLSVVAMSRPNPAFLTSREESKMLAGVAVSDLRRIVIDRMVNAGGWVTNDFVREVNGARVFVVTARTPKDSNAPEKAWTFYFTEAGGRIYGLTTDAPVEHTDRMATEAERFINNLRNKAQAGSR